MGDDGGVVKSAASIVAGGLLGGGTGARRGDGSGDISLPRVFLEQLF